MKEKEKGKRKKTSGKEMREKGKGRKRNTEKWIKATYKSLKHKTLLVGKERKNVKEKGKGEKKEKKGMLENGKGCKENTEK